MFAGNIATDFKHSTFFFQFTEETTLGYKFAGNIAIGLKQYYFSAS